jgi:cupin fold WbuC family metalloprotein
MIKRTTQAIQTATLDDLLAQARTSPRKRAIQRLHDGDWEHCHRLLNALTPGTYVRPHCHRDRFKGEGFVLLRGQLAVLIFSEDGALEADASRLLSHAGGHLGMEIPPGIWHCLVALEESVLYEVKGQPVGGYVQDTDKDFAPWSPAEGSAAAAAYVQQLEALARKIQNDE